MSGAGMSRLGGAGRHAGRAAVDDGQAAVIELHTDGELPVIEVIGDDPPLTEVVEPVVVGAEQLGVALDDLIDVEVPDGLAEGLPLLLRRESGQFVLREQTAPAELAHVHMQRFASSVWLILHPLPFTPAGLVVTSLLGEGRLWPQRVSHPAPGRARLDFTRPVTGIAYLS